MIDRAIVTPGHYNQFLPKHNHGQDVAAENRQNATIQDRQNDMFMDRVSLTYRTDTAATYNRSLTQTAPKQSGQFNLLKGLVINIFEEQGLNLNISIGNDDIVPKEIDLNDITQEEAAELVAEDGFFGVEQTSDRIVDFAISMAGNDPSRIDAIKAGIEKGFNEAMQAFGNWLPEISHQTYDAINEKLDAWVAESNEQMVIN